MIYSRPLIKKDKVNKNQYVFWFEADFKTEIKPGNFFQLKPEDNYSRLLRLPISVYDYFENRIGFLFQVVGKGTEELAKVKLGEKVSLIGPLGNSFPSRDEKKILFVSGGIGYAPLRYAYRSMHLDSDITWIHGARNIKEILIQNVDIAYTDDGSYGSKGYVTEGLIKFLQEEEVDEVYCCGPDIMMEKCTEICNKYNVPIQVSLETYMACGIGSCKGCAVAIKSNDEEFEYKTTCKDGPIFNGAKVLWNE